MNTGGIPRSSLYATSTSKTTNNLDEGAEIFESWFAKSVSKENDSLAKVRHCIFSNGIRGLEYIDPSSSKTDRRDNVIITLPKNKVLHSSSESQSLISNLNLRWDVSLAMQLLLEYQKGEKSDCYGYCQLLSQGINYQSGSSSTCPPSTAPNALRQWTKEQRDLFQKECGVRGKELIRIAENQNQEWKEQYHNLPASLQTTFTFEQFAWAMEAVYSRSFRGDIVSNLSKQLISTIAIPLAVTAFGVNYLISNPAQGNDAVTIALGLLGFLPLVLNNLDPKQNDSEAVLLPFIDSANHLEKADTRILYDPLKGIFTLSVSGDDALVDDKDCHGRKCTQLYISYGSKRDTELLLNYGFLTGVVLDLNLETDVQRRLLIEGFRKRNI